MEKKTTKELLGDYIDAEIRMEYANDDQDFHQADSDRQDAQLAISRKIDNIDYFMVNVDKKINLIDAEVDSLNKEIKRLRVRKKATESLKDYFNQSLIPMVITELGDENGVYETDTARYKLYETFGPVEVIDEEGVPDEYKTVKMTTVLNKKKARKSLTSGVDIPGFRIEKVKRVRRS